MPWEIVERRLGKAGGQKERLARQRRWDQKYGEGLWEIGYPFEGGFLSQTDALQSVYQKSYDVFFDEHPDVLQELITCAKVMRNPHALATTGVDLQVPAITRCLKSRGLELAGNEVLEVGSWQGQTSHPLSVRLSPLHIPCIAHEKMTLEKWWQTKKCLAVWED